MYNADVFQIKEKLIKRFTYLFIIYTYLLGKGLDIQSTCYFYLILLPPSTGIVKPVIKEASLLAKKHTTFAIS